LKEQSGGWEPVPRSGERDDGFKGGADEYRGDKKGRDKREGDILETGGGHDIYSLQMLVPDHLADAGTIAATVPVLIFRRFVGLFGSTRRKWAT
jgi:hypothetical protein